MGSLTITEKNIIFYVYIEVGTPNCLWFPVVTTGGGFEVM